MKKSKKTLFLILLICCMCFVSGCQLVEPETTHLVTIDETGRTLTAELKASVGDGYEWQYLLDKSILSETSSDFTDNIFSNTYGSTYTFTANDSGADTLYLILVQNGDYQNAKVFSFVISIDNNSNMKIEKEGNFVLGSNIKLYNRVTGK